MKSKSKNSLQSDQILTRSKRYYFIYYIASQAIFERGIFIIFLIDKGFTNEQIGALQSLLFIAAFACEIPSGLLGDKYGRKKTVVAGLLIFIGYCFGVISFSGFAAFLLFYACYGIAMSLISGSDRALIYDLYKDHGRENDFLKLESLSRSIGSAVLGLAIILGGVLQTHSWDAVYLSYAAAMIISLLAFILIPERKSTPEQHQEDISIMKDAMRYFIVGKGRLQLPIMIFMALLAFVYTPYYIFSQSAFVDKGLSVEAVSWIFAIAQFVSSLGYMTSDKLPPQHHIRIVFFACPLLIGLLLLCSGFVAVYAAVAIFFSVNYVLSVMEPIYTITLNEVFHSHIRAFANSFEGFVETVFVAIGFYVYSLLMTIVGFDTVVTYFSIIILVSVLLPAYYFRKGHQAKLLEQNF